MSTRSQTALLPSICLTFFSLALAGPLTAQRQITPEAKIFREYRDGVFTVISDQGHGTGFLVSAEGLILTNEHVVQESPRVVVKLDETLKVPARVLDRDSERDIAVLAIHPSFAEDRPVLQLAPQREELAYEGERVVAIGSPLHQERILTSGIVSKVEATAVISDVNANPGNSGGPMLNMDGEVIGMITFGDITDRGPGVSGAISIYETRTPLERGRTAHARLSDPPPATELPVMPRDAYPTWALERAALLDSWDTQAYNISAVEGTGDFLMAASTPPYLYRVSKQREMELTAKRNERVRQAGQTEGVRDPLDDLRNWFQFAGDTWAPVVVLQVSPKIGETGGSAFLNALGAALAGPAYRGSHTYEFKADLQEIQIRRNAQPAEFIERSTVLVPLDFYEVTYGGTYQGADLAQQGIVQLDYRLFQPEQNGQWPVIEIHAYDLKEEGEATRVTLPRRTVERVWSDFLPYIEQREADRARLVVQPGSDR